jgi:hypothetical protein
MPMRGRIQCEYGNCVIVLLSNDDVLARFDTATELPLREQIAKILIYARHSEARTSLIK